MVWIIKTRETSVIPKGVQIWIDGNNVSSTWGNGTAFQTGKLDLSSTSIATWDTGQHTIEFKETGGTGGRLQYYLYLYVADSPD